MFYFPVSTLVDGELFYSHDAILSTETSRRLDVLGQGLADCDYISPLNLTSRLAIHFLTQHSTPMGHHLELLHSYARQVFFWEYYTTTSTLRLLFKDVELAVQRGLATPARDTTDSQKACTQKVGRQLLKGGNLNIATRRYNTLSALWDHYAAHLRLIAEGGVIHFPTSAALLAEPNVCVRVE